MSASLVMTVIGKDRPGLVESVSAIISAHGGNWEESRMARLAGHFAGILRVSVPSVESARLAAALRALTAEGLEVVVAEARPEAAPAEGERVLRMELVGQDHPGIVHHLSQVIAGLGVNVDELETECVGAPWSGSALFKAQARLKVPRSVSREELMHALEEIAAEMMVDLSFDEATPKE